MAHSITGHKVQGQSILKRLTVAYDLKGIFEEAQGYVMQSRVEQLDQTYILDESKREKLYPSTKALKEVEKMDRISINGIKMG